MGANFDLVIRGGWVVAPRGVRRADVAVTEGRFAAIAAEIPSEGCRTIEAGGSYVLPGIIDAHVHFNEPGRTEWEGLASGSAALAAGGGVCYFDMPLNSEPPVLDAPRLREKRSLAEKKSRLDFALWGGLVPGNLESLGGLRDEGAVGLKAFLCPSGIDSFPAVDATALRAGMKRAKSLDLIVGVHAEDAELAAKFTARQRLLGRIDARAYLDSRPVEVETAAIGLALELAGETGCALHIVHVSSPEGLDLVVKARNQGVDVTAETCPHYLLLTDRDVERVGPPAKCAPPLRDESRRQELWRRLRSQEVSTVASDHSPAPPEMKANRDFFEVWGGIAGCQHGFDLLFSEVAATPDRDLPLLAALTAENVAARFRLDRRKGRIAEGFDADFTLVRFAGEREIHPEELLTRHRHSPYAGRRSCARITETWVRGRPAWSGGRLTEPPPMGQFLRPQPSR